MDVWLRAFKTIAPYLTHPLVLIGFVLLLFFGLLNHLIDSGIIPPLREGEASGIVYTLLNYVFVIGLAVIVLGFALQFYKTHQKRLSQKS